MSMLDIIAAYNRMKEEEALEIELDKRKRIILDLEKRTNLKKYSIKYLEKEMKKGSRVKIRRDSEYADENDGIGTMLGDFGSEQIDKLDKWAKVGFDDGKSSGNPYREKDLELAEKYTEEEIKKINKKNKKVLNEISKLSSGEFTQELEKQVQESIENSDNKTSYLKEFRVGDKIRLNAKATQDYPITKEGSEGEIIKDYEDGKFEIRFTKISTSNIPGKYNIRKIYMEHLISREYPEELAQSLVQESIEYVKKELKNSN